MTSPQPMSEDLIKKLLEGLPAGTTIWHSKGEFVAGGTTGIVERLSSGDVLKRVHTGKHPAIDEDNRRNLRTEAQIYAALGQHPRLLEFKAYDPKEDEILMEFVPNGRLDHYLRSHKETSQEQRLRWVDQAIESLEFLHSADVIHCDFGPHNLLLDQNLDLRITDFAGSSFRGSRPGVAGSDGYWLPNPKHQGAEATHAHDLFALGSTVYLIFNGHSPFEGLEGEAKNEKFRNSQFPDVTNMPCKKVVEGCWQQSIPSIQEARLKFQDYVILHESQEE